MMNRSTGTAKARKPAKADQADAALVADVERKVREDKALALGKLPKDQLSTSGLADLERKLVQRGLERGQGPRATVIRVPIEAQLLELVQGGNNVPLKGISTRVKGALTDAIKAEIDRLVRLGKLRVVVRTTEEVVVGADARVLSAVEISRLKKWVDQVASVLKKASAKGKPLAVMRDDLPALPAGLEALVMPASAPSPSPPPPPLPVVPPRRLVEAALRRLEDPKLKVVRIPDVVRELDGQLSKADVHHALSEAADRGALELHPDAGSEFLKAEDAALCPRGPRGTVFSYARLLSL